MAQMYPMPPIYDRSKMTFYDNSNMYNLKPVYDDLDVATTKDVSSSGAVNSDLAPLKAIINRQENLLKRIAEFESSLRSRLSNSLPSTTSIRDGLSKPPTDLTVIASQDQLPHSIFPILLRLQREGVKILFKVHQSSIAPLGNTELANWIHILAAGSQEFLERNNLNRTDFDLIVTLIVMGKDASVTTSKLILHPALKNGVINGEASILRYFARRAAQLRPIMASLYPESANTANGINQLASIEDFLDSVTASPNAIKQVVRKRASDDFIISGSDCVTLADLIAWSAIIANPKQFDQKCVQWSESIYKCF